MIDWLKRHPEFDRRLSRTARRHFFTTDDSAHFSEVASATLGTKVEGDSIAIDRDFR